MYCEFFNEFLNESYTLIDEQSFTIRRYLTQLWLENF